MSSAQLAGLGVTAICLVFLIGLLRRGHLRAKYVMVWMPVSLAMLVFSVVPGLLDDVSLWIGIAYPPALLFMLAIALLLLICMHFSWELSRVEERLRLLAEAIAIRDAEHDRSTAMPPHRHEVAGLAAVPPAGMHPPSSTPGGVRDGSWLDA